MLAVIALLALLSVSHAMFLPPQGLMDGNCPVNAPPQQGFVPEQMFIGNWIATDGHPVPPSVTCVELGFPNGFNTNSKTAHVNYTLVLSGTNMNYAFDMVQDASSNAVYNVNIQGSPPAQLTVMYTDYSTVSVLAQCIPTSGQTVVVMTRDGKEPSYIDTIKQKLAAGGFPVDAANFGPIQSGGC